MQSLNIEAYVKPNETDETASVDAIVRKIRTGEEMHSRMKALGHDRHRFIKTGAQPAATVKTKNYTELRLGASSCPREGAPGGALSSKYRRARSEPRVLTADALQMQNRRRRFVFWRWAKGKLVLEATIRATRTRLRSGAAARDRGAAAGWGGARSQERSWPRGAT